MERHQDFTLEMKRVHRAPKLTVIAIMIGALGTILKNAKAWLRRLSLPDIFGSVQLSAILGTAHISLLLSDAIDPNVMCCNIEWTG